MPILLPSKVDGGPNVELEPPTRIVLIGANGSGKTRFGIWLEEKNQGHMPVHRIGAQKALALPDFAVVKNLDQAEKELYFGRSDIHGTVDRKKIDRWGGKPATHMLSDYEALLTMLFAKEADRDRSHAERTRQEKKYIPVTDSPIDTIVNLWGYLMPHRVISFHDGQIIVGKGTPNEYHAKEMSDGERVTLYLLGQCLTTPAGALIVIDEPELHLHRSLMDKLWNKVEELCPDKSFVYITHDLDFAASRVGARKIWVHSYAADTWIWNDLPVDDVLPESLVLELAGNRKPVLFCEGERGGLDHSIYQICYSNHHVVARGGAEKVIESVKALGVNAALHTLIAFGIVDRDVRADAELEALLQQDVHAIQFAEVENLLCNESLIVAVAEKLALDKAAVLSAVTEYVTKSLREELEAQIVLRAARRVRYHLSCYTPTSNDRGGLEGGVNSLIGNLDLMQIISEAESVLNNALASGKINEILKFYNRKSLADRISTCFGLKHGEYTALVLRLLKGEDSERYIACLSEYLPQR